MTANRKGSITLRPATLADAAGLARLLEAFNGPVVAPDQIVSRLTLMQGVETVVLAEDLGTTTMIGFASLRLVPFLSDDAPYAELTELYVAEPYRRRGVGRALVAHVELLARERGARELHLLTGFKNVDAQAFYRVLGYADGALAMRKRLGP